MRVYRSLDGFQAKANVKTWIYTIAVNLCKNRLGSRKYRALIGASNEPVDIPDELFSPSIGFEKEETRLHVRQAVAVLYRIPTASSFL